MSNATLYQIIPNKVCLSCDVCCRFLESDSPLAPIFTKQETQKAITLGADPSLFQPMQDGNSSQITLKPYKDYYICPFFKPETSECLIYNNRPLDCQLYPFALMYTEDKSQIVLGIDMLCPYSEEHWQTEGFKQHLQHIINYVESDEISVQISSNWRLIGDYQDTVRVFHTFNDKFIHAATPSDN
ncbi:YkgJ family cysteine cluster protein [Candidatus Poribacteria bacterium]|nr:YkgJ family cysteine cluster protein [Candidatus Poribacteria bacterium]